MRPLQSGGFSALLRLASKKRLLSPLCETLKLNVSLGLFREDISKYPGSYFEKELSANSMNSETSVCRNGVLFKYINAFLVSGSLPRNASGQIDLDPKTLTLLKQEAEFYNLNSLKEECELLDVKTCRSNSFAPDVGLKSDPLSVIDFNAPLVNTLSQLWRPLVTQGVVDKNALPLKLFKNSSVSKVDAVDLITAAQKISPAKSGPYRIDASFLSKPALDAVAQTLPVKGMFEDQLVALKARELVIRTPERKDDLVSDNIGARLGSVEIILNSAYTGGELQAIDDGQVSHLSNVPYSWIAVYGDASHLWNTFVSPVTSGARVSLIYDIIPVTEVGQRLLVQHGSLDNCDLFYDMIMDDIWFTESDMDDLIRFARQVTPLATKEQILHLDPFFLKSETLAKVAQKADLFSLFPNQVLDIRPSDVLIHRKGARLNPVVNQKTHGKGYLGTLVVVTGSYFQGGEVHLSHGQEPLKTVDSPRMS